MGKAVEFVKINKYFPGVHVLKDISFSVEEGEVHALLDVYKRQIRICFRCGWQIWNSIPARQSRMP